MLEHPNPTSFSWFLQYYDGKWHDIRHATNPVLNGDRYTTEFSKIKASKICIQNRDGNNINSVLKMNDGDVTAMLC